MPRHLNPLFEAARQRAAILVLAVPNDNLGTAKFQVSKELGQEFPTVPRYKRMAIAAKAARLEYERRFPK
jgi:hypothetical protein